jgi:hypothetical protein
MTHLGHLLTANSPRNALDMDRATFADGGGYADGGTLLWVSALGDGFSGRGWGQTLQSRGLINKDAKR